MRRRTFNPDTILFSPTASCNLTCVHCDVRQTPGVLSTPAAKKFLKTAGKAGIKRVGFTGGEPFLAIDFLCALSKETLQHNMRFSRISTNGVWFRTSREMKHTLERLRGCGYDGDIYVSVDAFHRQSLIKVAAFIRRAVLVWMRPDIVSIVAIRGMREQETEKKLKKLTSLLQGRLRVLSRKQAYIKSNELFIRISFIDYSSAGKAGKLKNPWGCEWFQDDFCSGPGQVLLVLPDGTVKPCCGYANDSPLLTIGSIQRHRPQSLIDNACKNRFVRGIFELGLGTIRKNLEKGGVRFPGKTRDHCFFCSYIADTVKASLLKKVLY